MNAVSCYHTVHGSLTQRRNFSKKRFFLSLNFIIPEAGIVVCVGHKQGAQKSDTQQRAWRSNCRRLEAVTSPSVLPFITWRGRIQQQIPNFCALELQCFCAHFLGVLLGENKSHNKRMLSLFKTRSWKALFLTEYYMLNIISNIWF